MCERDCTVECFLSRSTLLCNEGKVPEITFTGQLAAPVNAGNKVVENKSVQSSYSSDKVHTPSTHSTCVLL